MAVSAPAAPKADKVTEMSIIRMYLDTGKIDDANEGEDGSSGHP